ncbi:hypothetical protein ACFSUS_24025 [Spirosoma soli]|uniref:Uncharacterized protein n=1 Tax=Spirosoma soli TaxID=1770529 RepID=A0ABW5MAN4_9BACT
MTKPKRSLRLCTKQLDKPLLLWGVAWHNGDNFALVVYKKGYSADCLPEEAARLIIINQRMSALSSECDLKSNDSLLEEYIKENGGNE